MNEKEDFIANDNITIATIAKMANVSTATVSYVINERTDKKVAEATRQKILDLCRKYNSVYELPVSQKWWFSFCIGKQLLQNEKNKEFGYEKNGYCRFAMEDKLLFDDMNRNKKNVSFKKSAAEYMETGIPDWKQAEFQEIPALSIEKNSVPDALDMEKFEDYCYVRRPSRFTKDFLRNDMYFYAATLYSVWTGKCYQKENGKHLYFQKFLTLKVDFIIRNLLLRKMGQFHLLAQQILIMV